MVSPRSFLEEIGPHLRVSGDVEHEARHEVEILGDSDDTDYDRLDGDYVEFVANLPSRSRNRLRTQWGL